MSSEMAALDAQRALLSVEQDLAVSEGTARQSLAAVIKAVGGEGGAVLEIERRCRPSPCDRDRFRLQIGV